MKLILTHDNADFDAIASLLAASKLDPAATPVLPRRVNRNVEHFLNLYSNALPFVHPDDLKRGGSVEHVTVVDTQSFSTVRGMRPATPVHFIDHHPLTRELSEEQRFTERRSALRPRCWSSRSMHSASRSSLWKRRC